MSVVYILRVRHSKHVSVSELAEIFPEDLPLGRFEVHQADQRYVCRIRTTFLDGGPSLGTRWYAQMPGLCFIYGYDVDAGTCTLAVYL